jgi:hypothetical protein
MADLVNHGGIGEWAERCELLLEDAFTGVAPRDDFNATSSAQRHEVLLRLLRRAPFLSEGTLARVPYWSERQRSRLPGKVSMLGTARALTRMVDDLDRRGYFEEAFGKDCVDGPREIDGPSALLRRELDVPDLWPLNAGRLGENRDLICDVIEVLHDMVSRPRSRSMHSYGGCGWHNSDFSMGSGQVIYRWSVNRVLDTSDLSLRLAEEGDDTGRLVEVTDEARTEFAASMSARTDPGAGDVVRHAIALFRRRDATEHDKRSAVVNLAGVLEERRSLIKDELVSKDEGALFQIANGFNIRHRNPSQRTDYDPAFLVAIHQG